LMLSAGAEYVVECTRVSSRDAMCCCSPAKVRLKSGEGRLSIRSLQCCLVSLLAILLFDYFTIYRKTTHARRGSRHPLCFQLRCDHSNQVFVQQGRVLALLCMISISQQFNKAGLETIGSRLRLLGGKYCRTSQQNHFRSRRHTTARRKILSHKSAESLWF
jgi:hypothetical protein